jgi:hypothetical protein
MFMKKGFLRHLLLIFAVGLAFLISAAWIAFGSARASPKNILPFNLYFPFLPNNYPVSIMGTVVDANGPLAGATVRIRATENKTLSAADGTFTLTGLTPGEPVSVTAWSDGYFVGWVDTVPNTRPVTITLRPYYTSDNPDYEWFSFDGDTGSLSCSHCMPCYTEWQVDAHAGASTNPRFVSMYNGTDLHGNQSPPTENVCVPDYGCFPLPPDPAQPYYGPGYKLDFPDTAGNCATCHAPADAAKPGMAYNVDINSLSEIGQEGVFCEFCHKIGEVTLDPQTDLPYANLPGVLSLRLFRPPADEQLFFGNFDDVTRRVSYLPLEQQSAFCAPCHFGLFWDVPIYNSYGEWLDSPYSDPETGQTCQDCHMPTVDYDYIVYPEKGGLIRDHSRIFSHLMPGAMDETLLQNALTMTTTAQLSQGQLRVQVTLTNDRTGHHVPTDSPLRQLILLVEACDDQGHALTYLAGPTVPDWSGVGDPAAGYYADLPGTAYAKILEEAWTGVSPTGAYWNQVRLLTDNRLAAFESDTSTYIFAGPQDASVDVQVKLLYRRAFIALIDWKDWGVPDILMASNHIVIQNQP